MKRFIFFVSIFGFVSLTVCFARDTRIIDSLIIADIEGNIDLIQEETFGLDEDELLAIYNRHKKSAWPGALINYAAGGFGLGNFMQGDIRSGRIALTGYLASIGFAVFVPIIGSELIKGDWIPVFYLGALSAGVFHIYGFVRTIVYPSTYNKTLKTALQIGQTRLSVEPSLAITGKEIALSASIRF